MKLLVEFEKKATVYSDERDDYVTVTATGVVDAYQSYNLCPNGELGCFEVEFSEAVVSYRVDGVSAIGTVNVSDIACSGGFTLDNVSEVFARYGFKVTNVTEVED